MFLTGSRGEWGYIRPVIESAERQGHTCQICATNMHIAHGTSSFIEEDGYTVHWRLPMSAHDDTGSHSMALGGFLAGFSKLLNEVKPDWLVLAGDRGEQLMGAIAGAYSYIPTAHIQAGERSGNIDNSARMAIAKLAHLHFAANLDASVRLQHLGEEPWRIHLTGAPQLDDIMPGSEHPYGGKPYILSVFHPTTSESEQAEKQMVALRRALDGVRAMQVWICPNNDPGHKGVSAAMPHAGSKVYQSIPRSQYLQLLEHAECIVGNSSSGLLEAPAFGTPCVNIGNRQQDRHRGPNVIDVPEYDNNLICDAIAKAMQMPRTPTNEYGDGHSADRIVNALSAMRSAKNITTKRMVY
jgi:GDP/UDP-N,N'-diacetylbacillosamine 2-epimerase (hydrolysing)